MKAELLYQCPNETGEAVIWLPAKNKVAWVDIENRTLYTLDISTRCAETHLFPDMVTAIIPFTGSDDDLLLARKDRLIAYNLVSKKSITLIKLNDLAEDMRTNDGKASPDGRIWLGAIHLNNHNETGALYCIESGGRVRKVLTRQSIPNGIVWNSAGDTMYYADSGKGCIFAFSYNRLTGVLGQPRIAVKVPKAYGIPDGMTIDAADNLWVSHWGGFGVYIWNPRNGMLIDKIELPVPQPASCTFGGSNNDMLFVTTARAGLSARELEKYPLSGSLFAVRVKAVPGNNHYPCSLKP